MFTAGCRQKHHGDDVRLYPINNGPMDSRFYLIIIIIIIVFAAPCLGKYNNSPNPGRET